MQKCQKCGAKLVLNTSIDRKLCARCDPAERIQLATREDDAAALGATVVRGPCRASDWSQAGVGDNAETTDAAATSAQPP